MNCDQVRVALSAIRPASRDGELPELVSEMAHVGQCADCQAHWEAQQAVDREISRVMCDVAIPVDFQSRLLANLTAVLNPEANNVDGEDGDSRTLAASATGAEIPVAIPVSADRVERPETVEKKSGRRRWAAAVTAALLLLAIGGVWLIQTQRQIRFPVSELVAFSHSPAIANAPAFEQSFRPELPSTEINIPAQPKAMQVRSLRERGQELGAVFLYQVPVSRGKPLSVVLVVVDLERVAVPDLASVADSFRKSEVIYPKPNLHATRVWKSGRNLYVCYVRSQNPEDLDSLMTRFQFS